MPECLQKITPGEVHFLSQAHKARTSGSSVLTGHSMKVRYKQLKNPQARMDECATHVDRKEQQDHNDPMKTPYSEQL